MKSVNITNFSHYFSRILNNKHHKNLRHLAILNNCIKKNIEIHPITTLGSNSIIYNGLDVLLVHLWNNKKKIIIKKYKYINKYV